MRWDRHLEGDFYQCMHQLDQVDKHWNRRVLEFYIPHFARRRRVLDVGCGEGQFIELLTANGVEAAGIDIDPGMVGSCRRKDLPVVEADLFDYLPEHRRTFDGIFSSNLVEHFPAVNTFRFAELAFESLCPGGVFVIATPNPASLIVHLHEFWRDATHVRLYTAPLLEFVLHRSGFEQVASGGNSRTTWSPGFGLDNVPSLLRDLSAWEEQEALGSFAEGESSPTRREPERSLWRRLVRRLRRRVARFLAGTILSEEFASLERQVRALRQIDQSLYQNLDVILTSPREIYAKGIRPTDEPGESP
ncbi:MAG: class I SAM-dependent methyltransferase [Anaerolineae bacterium]|jgi:SAM-dependent methyltransferase